MQKRFNDYIKKNKLFLQKDKLIVGLSGGADSMVLCDLLKQNGFHFSVAHCNFLLRGKEANDDEKFVLKFAKENGIKAFSKQFKTKEYAQKKSISIQMAARELRYQWFNELLKEHKFTYLLTAHHANDNVETFFINLLRGSGIKGLKGIEVKKDTIVRPLLFATRAEIERYAAENKILYREDSSNADDKYLRNKLRLHIIPELKKLNPSLEQTILNEMEILQQADLITKREVEKQKKNLISQIGKQLKIDIQKLQKTVAPKLFLFELINEFGFNSAQADGVYNTLKAISGKVFESGTHMLVKDRNFLLIKEKDNKKPAQDFLIRKTDKEIKRPVHLKISFKKGNLNTLTKKDFSPNKLFADADKLQFPLTLNYWQTGDKFKPLGMSGFKKVSDFFISQKATLFDKQNQIMLRSNDQIVWLVGKRSDERFKITSSTKTILVVEVLV